MDGFEQQGRILTEGSDGHPMGSRFATLHVSDATPIF